MVHRGLNGNAISSAHARYNHSLDHTATRQAQYGGARNADTSRGSPQSPRRCAAAVISSSSLRTTIKSHPASQQRRRRQQHSREFGGAFRVVPPPQLPPLRLGKSRQGVAQQIVRESLHHQMSYDRAPLTRCATNSSTTIVLPRAQTPQRRACVYVCVTTASTS